MAEVHPADPRARRIALVILAAAFVAGLALLWGLSAGGPAVARWLRRDPATVAAKARLLVAALAVIMAGPPAAAGAYLLRFGARVVSEGRFPPAGVRMVQDVGVLTGESARRRGRIAQALGLLLVLTAGAMVVVLWTLRPR